MFGRRTATIPDLPTCPPRLGLRCGDRIAIVGAWHQLVVGAVTWAIVRCLTSAADSQAAVEGDTTKFRRSPGVRRLGFFPLGAAMLISSFLFGFGERKAIPWLLAMGAAWWLFVRLITPAEIRVTPREIRKSSWFGPFGKVIPWAQASHAVIVPQSYVIKGRVVKYDDIVVVHKDGETRIKHSEGHEDPKGFVKEIQQHVRVYRSESDPMAFVEPLDLDLESRPG